MFTPKAAQFNTAIRLQHRVSTIVNGAPDVTYVDASPAVHLCDFKPFYGTESLQAGQLGVEDGGTVTMWYVPGVKASDRILLNDDSSLAYEIFGSPENIDNRGIYLTFKVRRVVSS